jgi:glycerol-3-phosphate acyltransferase PlsY
MSTTLTSIVISYLLGSIPSGVIITKYFNLGEIRNIGSGSTGATNVLRTGNYLASALTLFFDIFKSLVAVKICQIFYPDKFLLTAIFILIGHIFPIWLKNFSGGKGYASFLGVLLAVDLLLFVIVISAWSIVFLLFRISSLSALISIIALVIATYNITNVQYKEVFLIAATIILISHAKNILRLIQGKEQKLK